MLRRLSIRAVLGTIVTLMGALLILMAGFSMQSAFQRNRAAHRVLALATIDGHVFDALLTFRHFRKPSRCLLASQELITPS